jgi:hypothetical protein
MRLGLHIFYHILSSVNDYLFVSFFTALSAKNKVK